MVAYEHPVYFTTEKKAERTDRVKVVLDVASVVLGVLRDVARCSPVPGLSEVASVAVAIADVVAKARINKDGLRHLAEDSTELVYTIIHAHEDIMRVQPEDIPADLSAHLQQLVTTLALIHKFAVKTTRRNFFIAMIRFNDDARRIQAYREKLRQSIRVFNLQSNISLRSTVHKLMVQQGEIMDELRNRETSIRSGHIL